MQKKITKKYFLGCLIFFLTFFLFSSDKVFAANDVGVIVSGIGSAFILALETIVKTLLYALFVFLGWIASVAVALFGWAISPEFAYGPNGLFNRQSVYLLWQFVRDFFNLGFILVLLFSAFGTVFQIEKFNAKKIILSVLLAALLVNFSFPISRFLIDVSNVPMYFFAQQMANSGTAGTSAAFGEALKASQLQVILLGDPSAKVVDLDTASKYGIERFIAAVVFLFLFTVSILVLAVMFVIRVVGLVVLVIFSSVGFAASVMPGLSKYSKQWWDQFIEYLLFGPAAMLMLVVATRFFSEIGNENGMVAKGFNEAGARVTAGQSAGDLVGSMAMFTIPIIMIWMSISLANKFKIAGADMITGWGNKMINWGKKGAFGYANILTFGGLTRARNFGAGAAEAVKSVPKTGKLFGKPVMSQRFTESGQEEATAVWKGRISKGWGGGDKARDQFRNKKIYDKVEENKKDNVSNSALQLALNDLKKDPVSAAAAAISLAERKAVMKPDQLLKSIEALKNNDKEMLKVIENAGSDALSMNSEEVGKLLQGSDLFAAVDPNTLKVIREVGPDGVERNKINPESDAFKAFKNKLKKEGQYKVFIDYSINAKAFEKKANTEEEKSVVREEVYAETVGKLSADDLAKQWSIHKGIQTDENLKKFIAKRAEEDGQLYQEAMKKMSGNDRKIWFENIGPLSSQKKEKDTEQDRVREKMREAKRESGR